MSYEFPKPIKNEAYIAADKVYHPVKILGSGSFGSVVKSIDMDTKETVAIKILKNEHITHYRQGFTEGVILARLTEADGDQHNIVRFHNRFVYNCHTFLVCELLDQSLYDYMKENDFKPLPLQCVRPILQQLLVALAKLKEMQVVHADLKPDNIMLVDMVRQPWRVKLIDFGCAFTTNASVLSTWSRQRPESQLQARYYRAPDVMLGLPVTQAIDMWSLGCVVTELFIGCNLFPGCTEFDQFRLMCKLRGVPSQHTLNLATRTKKFFLRTPKNPSSLWRLKGCLKNEFLYKFCLKNLDQLKNMHLPKRLNYRQMYTETKDRMVFIQLLERMLTMSVEDERITPADALNHPFLSMQHFAFKRFKNCTNVKISINLMAVCRKNDDKMMKTQPPSRNPSSVAEPYLRPLAPSKTNQVSSVPSRETLLAQNAKQEVESSTGKRQLLYKSNKSKENKPPNSN